jgi:hypothetical protein
MTHKENIRAILECHFTGFKEDIIDSACNRILEQEPRWIPTSERLPEEDGEYYATVYDTDENYKYMDIAELEDGIWQYKDYVKVLAWMPLPEPYKVESEG